MENLIEKLKNKIFNNRKLIGFFILAIIFTIYLDVLILLIKKIFLLSFVFHIITISDRILFLTFLALIWYAWETRGMKNEIVTQTELFQKPILIMYIRNINEYDEKGKKKQQQQKEYCIDTKLTSVAKNFDEGGGFGSDLCLAETFKKYLIRVRNVGKGPAFNTEVSNENFKVEKYQSQFFAPEPKGDEQSIKIIRKDEKEIEGNYSDLNNNTFKIFCENINKKKYYFKYKIIDTEKQIVKFIG